MTNQADALYQRVLAHPATPARARRLLQTLAILAREIVRDQMHVRAATLAYWSLVAIVPALVLVAAVLRPFGAGHAMSQLLFSALLAGSVQDVGATIDGWLDQVDVTRLGIIGVIGVAFTASRIYFSVEEAYNRLWNVHLKRTFILRLILFYVGLTLTPLLVAGGFQLTGRLQDAFGGSTLRHLLPVLLTAVAFVGAIRILPDTKVRWGPALAGGLTSASLFEAAKVGFNTYVEVLGAGSASTAIYGSLGLFPVFLLWLYVLWLIVLFGVELAYVAQRHDDLIEAEDRHLLGERNKRRHPDALFAVQCLLVVARNFAVGAGPTSEPSVTHALKSEPAFVRDALDTLVEAGILSESDKGYLPASPLERITLHDVIARYRHLTLPALAEDAPGHTVVASLLGGGPEGLDVTVNALVSKIDDK